MTRVRAGERLEAAAVSLSEPLLDCAAAALLNVRVSWVRDAAGGGRLPCLRVGRHMRFTRAILEEWLAEQAGRPASRGRPFAAPAGVSGGRPARGAYRGRTSAALLASLAESPKRGDSGGG